MLCFPALADGVVQVVVALGAQLALTVRAHPPELPVPVP